MGMELEREADFRWKATRRSRKQVANAVANNNVVTSPTLGISPSPSSTFRSFFGRKNSSTTTAGSLAQSMPSPALTTSSQLEGTSSLESAMLSPTVSNHSVLQPQISGGTTATSGTVALAITPFYGGTSDSGGEVRWSVEITRIKNLTNIYTLEFKRIKGSLSDYRANHVSLLVHAAACPLIVSLYYQDALIDRLDFGSTL